MAILSEQLEAIFQEIKDNFAQHRQIQVTPIAGDPPEQYRITYHLQGLCREDRGEVRECTDHIITITLPFGFPHFPPNCKPESPVFHPDFDQAAICIGEFWENNNSLSELIIHIGRMICGESYSSNNAFNEEAAVWYKENQKKLPLDTIHPLPAPVDLLSFPEEQTAPSSAPLAMDIVDDAFFASSETAEKSTLAEPMAEETLTVDRSSATPKEYPKPDSKHLDNETEHLLVKARQIHQEGEAFEHQGQPSKALARYRATKDLAPDFPEIDKDISRAQYSLEMLGDWAEDSSPEKELKAKKKSAAKVNEKASSLVQKKKPAERKEKKQGSHWPLIVIGSGCAALLLTVTVATLFYNIKLQQAQTLFAECGQLLDKEQFTDAEQKCSAALKLTDKIVLIKQQEKKLLTERIQQIQGSQQLKEGLALSREEKPKILPEWQQAKDLADKQQAEEKWKEALASYTLALQLASEIPTVDRTLLEQLRNNRTTAQINIYLQAGEQNLAASEWEYARNHFDQAMELARQNAQTPAAVISRIKSLSGQAEFNTMMASAEGYFSQEDWQNALTSFEKAQELEQNFSFADSKTVASLQESIIRSKVFNSLHQGKKAFANAQWDQAIDQYETAIQLLEENSDLLRRDNPLQSQQKISKLMLHATVIRDQQSTANHLKNKEFSEAIDKLQAIIETISMSSFAREEEFQTILKETRSSMNQAQEDLLMAEHISYLTKNYQKLFTQNNPALIAENLSQPRVTFLKKMGNRLLYKIQCFEEGHSRPVLLQTSYLYDPATNKWRFFNKDNANNGQEFDTTGQNILTKAYKAKEDRLIEEQISYLTNNFQTLFVESNPALSRENLVKPQASFLRKIGKKMLFMLQCLDQGAANDKPVFLKSNYLYDPATKQWEPYDKKKDT